ncbi:hypothetical protein ACOTEY_25920 [Achromobacter xylosoxidans]
MLGFCVSLNISANEAKPGSGRALAERVLQATGLPPSWIIIELAKSPDTELIEEGAETEEHVNVVPSPAFPSCKGWHFEHAQALEKLLEALLVKGGRVSHKDEQGADRAPARQHPPAGGFVAGNRQRVTRPGGSPPGTAEAAQATQSRRRIAVHGLSTGEQWRLPINVSRPPKQCHGYEERTG